MTKEKGAQKAQRCAAVAAGQTQRAKPAQGRADLRAAKHSGGQASLRLAGRGPLKNKIRSCFKPLETEK